MFRVPVQRHVPRGAYPEGPEPADSWLSRLTRRAKLSCLEACARPKFLGRFVRLVNSHGPAYAGLKGDGTLQEARLLRQQLREAGIRRDLTARSFALAREVASQRIGQRHFDVQLIGGWVLLHGLVAEMETGEGKTLTATLAACTAALAGIPVHIITVNDYLTDRDARWMGPIYEALGLRVGVIVHGMSHPARQQAYACDVVYCTNKEITFDYLRDRITLGQNCGHAHLQLERLYGGATRQDRLLLRGLEYAIVDEADSVLVDEARTPLIISSPQTSEEERNAYNTALRLAEKMEREKHFTIEQKERRVVLTSKGKLQLDDLIASSVNLRGIWSRRQFSQEMVLQALTAKYVYFRDRDYLIEDNKVQIIDEYTGRTMPDRSWEYGLHQAIEARENCPVTPKNVPIARISYQRFFRRYLHLAGMTGTAREVAGELASVYGLGVVTIPTNKPLRRQPHAARVFATADKKWKAIVERIKSVHQSGRPVLIGTRSVETSQHLSRLLEVAGLPHQVLNARQDKNEATIIARAGEPSTITVATNMAGRGTDILIPEKVVERGGLHVIASEIHEAKRIDRQLFGRCGRQGDLGSHEAILSLDDELVVIHGKKLKHLLFPRRPQNGNPVSSWLGALLFRRAQRAAERRHRQMRQDLLRMDEYIETALAFSGVGE